MSTRMLNTVEKLKKRKYIERYFSPNQLQRSQIVQKQYLELLYCCAKKEDRPMIKKTQDNHLFCILSNHIHTLNCAHIPQILSC